MLKKKARTSITRLDGHKLVQLSNDDLRRSLGGLPKECTTGACTLNCDDWADCD